MIAVRGPDRVRVRRKNGAEEEHTGIFEARVVGGKYAHGDGSSFLCGFEHPRGILLVRSDGKAKKIIDADMVVFHGGRLFAPKKSVLGASADEVAARVMAGVNIDSSTSIEDGPPVHVLDSGAGMEIADEPPIDPDDLPDVGEPESAATGERGEEEVLGANIRGGRSVYPVHRESVRDDFTERLRQEARAYIGPNGEILDEFDARYRMQGAEHQALVQEAPFTRNNPPTAMRGILGNQLRVWAGAGVGGPRPTAVELARWDGEDAESMPVSVMVAPLFETSPDAGSALLRAYATIRFGTRGYLSPMEVDIGRGFQLTVPASYVSVEAALETVTGTARSLLVTGMLSFHPIVRTPNLTRTIYVDDLDGTSDVFVLPQFAKTFQYRGSANAEAITIRFYDCGGVVYTLNVAVSAVPQQLTEIQLSPDWVALELVKMPGSAVANIWLIFGLTV